MTRNEALQIVSEVINTMNLDAFTAEQHAKIADALEVVAAMREKLSTPRKSSDEAKAKAATKRATERANAIKDVLPIVRETIISNPNLTAKEIFEKCSEKLPEDWNANKVQYLLLHEMSEEVHKVEAKGKANTYYIA